MDGGVIGTQIISVIRNDGIEMPEYLWEYIDGYEKPTGIPCNTDPCNTNFDAHFEYDDGHSGTTGIGFCGKPEYQSMCTCSEYPNYFCRKFTTGKLLINKNSKVYLKRIYCDDYGFIKLNGKTFLISALDNSSYPQFHWTHLWFVDLTESNIMNTLLYDEKSFIPYQSWLKYMNYAQYHFSYLAPIDIDITRFFNFDGNDVINAVIINNGGPSIFDIKIEIV